LLWCLKKYKIKWVRDACNLILNLKQSRLEKLIIRLLWGPPNRSNLDCFLNLYCSQFVSLRGVVVDLSDLRDRGPAFKSRSRPLTFTKADTNFRTLHVVGFSCTNEFYRIPSCKRRQNTWIKSYELTELWIVW
jgi:hypothetical protein